jgi:hypothetical protein
MLIFYWISLVVTMLAVLEELGGDATTGGLFEGTPPRFHHRSLPCQRCFSADTRAIGTDTDLAEVRDAHGAV